MTTPNISLKRISQGEYEGELDGVKVSILRCAVGRHHGGRRKHFSEAPHWKVWDDQGVLISDGNATMQRAIAGARLAIKHRPSAHDVAVKAHPEAKEPSMSNQTRREVAKTLRQAALVLDAAASED